VIELTIGILADHGTTEAEPDCAYITSTAVQVPCSYPNGKVPSCLHVLQVATFFTDVTILYQL